MSLTGAYQSSPAHSRWAAFWLRRGARFRRPEAVAISMPSRGVLARRWNGSCGLTAACLFPVPVPYESKLSTGPKPKTAGCFRNQLPFIVLRREREEMHIFRLILRNHSFLVETIQIIDFTVLMHR